MRQKPHVYEKKGIKLSRKVKHYKIKMLRFMRKMVKKLRRQKSCVYDFKSFNVSRKNMLVYKNNVMSLQELSYNFTRQKPYFLR